MYTSFYKLDKTPFAFAPSPECFYANAELCESLRTLRRVILRGEGPALIVGPNGTGKSTICELLVEHFRKSHQIVHFRSASFATGRDIIEQFSLSLGGTVLQQTTAELRTTIASRVCNLVENPEPILLVVDEAHRIPPEIIRELQSLQNIVHQGKSRICIILAGTLKIEEILTDPTLESFNQRIAHRCYVAAASRMETKALINEQLVQAGRSVSEIFTRGALRRIYEFTQGIPRIINLLADRCLIVGQQREIQVIEEHDVELAWADLQQLPPPKPVATEEESSTKDNSAKPSTTVEFGMLSDV
ncbi:MAG: AAA family ATPase [Planctomycetaceae bacterium]|jgi:type II secretory pathway predicted ATPase ExeA|nr:AAA family ATPase [Planctomycetaceae bacterium]